MYLSPDDVIVSITKYIVLPKLWLLSTISAKLSQLESFSEFFTNSPQQPPALWADKGGIFKSCPRVQKLRI